jgi:protein TonB
MFEDTLIESTPKPQKTVGGMSLPLSIALHALIIGAMAAASLWFVDDSAEPPVPVIFYSPGFPPPPPGSGPKADSVPRRTRRSVAPAFPSIAILRTAPFEMPERDGLPLSSDDVSANGGGSGDPKGVPFGTGDTEEGAGGTGLRGEAILHPGGDVRPPLLIACVEPAYPETERKLHKEGIVILEAIITSDGTVDEVHVLKSADSLLDEAAKRAVIQWRYRPATLNGRAVRVYLEVTVSFRLH